MREEKGGKGRKIIKYLFPILILILTLLIISADETSTTLNIGLNGSYPLLDKIIEDQNIAENTNLLNAFDLDDYFKDGNDQNETLTYNSSSIENITIAHIRYPPPRMRHKTKTGANNIRSIESKLGRDRKTFISTYKLNLQYSLTRATISVTGIFLTQLPLLRAKTT